MKTPKISVIVIVYDMAQQALTTLRSLSPAYQRRIDAADYEVIVVENRSARVIDPADVAALPPNFTYVLRDEPGKSPAAAINHGLSLARGDCIGLMIDGARMLTPGVLTHVDMALRITKRAVVAIPGYQLGPTPHNQTETQTEEIDRQMLAEIGWPADGYRLFEIASMSLANRAGFFRSFMECNCLFAPADALRALGGADERFDLPGGGALNLYLYKRLIEFPRSKFFMLPGEGSFHQVHGGVTTTPREDEQALHDRILAQLTGILGEPFKSPTAEPVHLGVFHHPVHPFLRFSAEKFAQRARVHMAALAERTSKAAESSLQEDGADEA
jgi:hypothetical protein